MTTSRPTLDPGATDGSEEPNLLGASATLPGGRKGRLRGRRGQSPGPDGAQTRSDDQPERNAGPRSSASSPIKGVVIAIAAVLIFAAMPVVTSAFKRTPSDKIGVSYSGGPFSGSTFQRVVDPGAGYFFNGFWSHLYLYPAGSISYSMPDPSAEAGILERAEVVFPSSDHVPVTVTVTVHYRLNRDDIASFHESVGAAHAAHTDEGWAQMERQVIRSALSGSVQETLAGTDTESLISASDSVTQLESSMATRLGERLEAATGGRFFCAPEHSPGDLCGDPVVVIGSVEVPTWAGPNADRADEGAGPGD